MRTTWRTAVSTCLLLMLAAVGSVSGHAVDRQTRAAELQQDHGGRASQKESKALDVESMFAGFAKSMIGRTGSSSSQLLSLNLSNVVLMLVLKGLIWGASYMQLIGGDGKGRKEGHLQDAITETDVLLFLGYLVADESGHQDCLNRVACEQPSRAEGYLRSAGLVWNTAKMLDGIVPLDGKYEDMLNRLQEAVEDGRANGDCEAKYKCSDSANTEDKFNLV